MTARDRMTRVGRNEALFRNVNQTIENVNEAFGARAEDLTIVCECADATCAVDPRANEQR